MQNIVRVLIAKPGLDGHDRGAKVVARALRDAGMEVIYTGLHQTPEMVVNSAIQEDVNVVGLSILSGAHVPLVEAILKLMKKEKFERPVFVGGIIPDDDAQQLKKMGVSAVYGPGTNLTEISEGVRRFASGSGGSGNASVKKKPSASKGGALKKRAHAGKKSTKKAKSKKSPKAKPKK